MKNAIICGAGKMGCAIGYGMKKLGYSISIVENNEQNKNKFFLINGNCPSYQHWSEIDKQVDIFISSLPYHATLDAAIWCIDKGIRYCDLGGSVQVSMQIKDLANARSQMPVMTDLGLAPGWINIIAEDLYRLMPKADTIKMMVGGVPRNPIATDPLKYMLTWSTDGLINEYEDHCEVLQNGKKELLEGMSDLEDVNVCGLTLEAFNTSGAIAHTIDVMSHRGVKNCVYKTIRWPGHCNIIKFLLGMKDKSLLEKVLSCGSANYKEDMVVLEASVNNSNRNIKVNQIVYPKYGFSAMQRATALPLSAVADILARGMLDKYPCPTYDYIPQDIFNDNLNNLLD